MKKEADEHSEDDKQRKEKVEIRNNGDSGQPRMGSHETVGVASAYPSDRP